MRLCQLCIDRGVPAIPFESQDRLAAHLRIRHGLTESAAAKAAHREAEAPPRRRQTSRPRLPTVPDAPRRPNTRREHLRTEMATPRVAWRALLAAGAEQRAEPGPAADAAFAEAWGQFSDSLWMASLVTTTGESR